MWNLCLRYRWLAALLLVAVVGCSKLNEARFFAAGTPAAATSGKRTTAGKWASFDLKKLCDKLKGAGEVPKRRIAEYAALRKMVLAMSPWIAANPQLAARAHAQAYRRTNEAVVSVIKAGGKAKEAALVAELIQANVDYAKLEGDERDLEFLLRKLFALPDEGACSNAYLEQFYTNYVHSLDLFGTIVFGSNNTQAQPDTLSLTLEVPAPIAKAAAVAEAHDGSSSALWLTLTQWKSSPAADEVAAALDKHSQPLILDLRFAGGEDRAVLARFRAGLAGPWSAVPLIVLVNSSTRGAAAIFAYEAANRPHVLVLGSSAEPEAETYGYGRVLKQQSSVLVEGLTPVVITLGAELLQPSPESGSEHNSEGYRLRVRNENLIKDLTPAAVVKKAESWTQSLLGDAPRQSETPPVAQPAPVLGQQGYDSQERAPAQMDAAPAYINPEPYGPNGPRIENDPMPADQAAQRESEVLQQRLQAEAGAAAQSAPRSI